MKRIQIFQLLCLFTFLCAAMPANAQSIDHSSFANILKEHVSSTGVVDYGAMKGKEGQLDAYLEKLSSGAPDANRAEKMSYWINLYNAATLKLILSNQPLKSITDLEGGKPWDKKWIQVDGESLSLNQIENDIIRPRFKDARIHFAVNCAARSCPSLLNDAYTAANLDLKLEEQTKKFVNNRAFNKIDGKHVMLSKIFEWYAVDFGDLTEFINQYSDTKVGPNATFSYIEYNWALNN